LRQAFRRGKETAKDGPKEHRSCFLDRKALKAIKGKSGATVVAPFRELGQESPVLRTTAATATVEVVQD